jgi:type II secretory pathway component PulF
VLKNFLQKAKQLLFTSKEQQAFLEDVASLVEDGITPTQAVSVMRNVTTGIKADVAQNILMRLAEGKYLADGLRNWFPNAVVEIVRAGEEGGTLAKTLRVAAAAVTRKTFVINALISALAYPLVVLALGLGVSVFLNHSILQQFATIKPINLWPTIAQNAVVFATLVQNWWWMVVILIIAGLFLLSYFLRTYAGNGRKLIDALPVFSLYRQFTAANFMEVLGLLASNGVILKKALRILQYNANPYLGAHLLTMEYRLSGGKENIAEVLDTGLLDKNDLMRLRVIAIGKGFEHALVRQGMRAGEMGMQRVQTLARLFGGVLLGLGAMLAAFMILSIYSVGSILAT